MFFFRLSKDHPFNAFIHVAFYCQHIINRKHRDIHPLLYCTIHPFHISWLSNIDHRSSTNEHRTQIIIIIIIIYYLLLRSLNLSQSNPSFSHILAFEHRSSIIDQRPTNIEHRSSSLSSYITSYYDL